MSKPQSHLDITISRAGVCEQDSPGSSRPLNVIVIVLFSGICLQQPWPGRCTHEKGSKVSSHVVLWSLFLLSHPHVVKASEAFGTIAWTALPCREARLAAIALWLSKSDHASFVLLCFQRLFITALKDKLPVFWTLAGRERHHKSKLMLLEACVVARTQSRAQGDNALCPLEASMSISAITVDSVWTTVRWKHHLDRSQ
jgi:hypothetical protein